jgi:carbonic anhydrase
MGDAFTDLAAGNERYVRTHRRLRSGVPARGLALVTCMDARIDPLKVLHLKAGDAVVLRVAGAQVDDTVLRHLLVARAALHVDRLLVMAHTDCAANRLTGEDVRAAAEGAEVRLEGRGERNPEEALHRDLDLLLRTPALRELPLAGAVLDVVTGRLRVTRRHNEHLRPAVRPRGST